MTKFQTGSFIEAIEYQTKLDAEQEALDALNTNTDPSATYYLRLKLDKAQAARISAELRHR